MLSVVEQARAELALDLDELVHEGAGRMLAVALEAEVEAYRLPTLADRWARAPAGGTQRSRPGADDTGAGQVQAVRPRVADRRVDPVTGRSVQFQHDPAALVLALSEGRRGLPLLYLHGLSGLDFVPTLERFFGPPLAFLPRS